jgi:hypothetical protein
MQYSLSSEEKITAHRKPSPLSIEAYLDQMSLPDEPAQGLSEATLSVGLDRLFAGQDPSFLLKKNVLVENPFLRADTAESYDEPQRLVPDREPELFFTWPASEPLSVERAALAGLRESLRHMQKRAEIGHSEAQYMTEREDDSSYQNQRTHFAPSQVSSYEHPSPEEKDTSSTQGGELYSAPRARGIVESFSASQEHAEQPEGREVRDELLARLPSLAGGAKEHEGDLQKTTPRAKEQTQKRGALQEASEQVGVPRFIREQESSAPLGSPTPARFFAGLFIEANPMLGFLPDAQGSLSIYTNSVELLNDKKKKIQPPKNEQETFRTGSLAKPVPLFFARRQRRESSLAPKGLLSSGWSLRTRHVMSPFMKEENPNNERTQISLSLVELPVTQQTTTGPNKVESELARKKEEQREGSSPISPDFPTLLSSS